MEKNSFYKETILREFYFTGIFSSAQLSGRINKSLPLTIKILNELVEEGYVYEHGLAPSRGGRRAMMYAIRTDNLYVVSVAMDQMVTRISVMDVLNRHVTEVMKFELPLQGGQATLSELAKKINQLIELSGIERARIAGVGIGMPGFIDSKKGINYTYFVKAGKTITQQLAEEIGLPVYIDNDSSLIALAEFRFGAARQKQNVMVVNIGWGVGLGIIANGEIFRGQDGFAGEFSHIPLFSNNKLCVCGKTGCLETEASLLVVIEKAIRGLAQGRSSILAQSLPTGHYEQDFDAIVQAALKGDRFAVELFSEAGYNIGRGVAVLIHLFNPALVVLSGRGALAGNLLLAPLQQALNEHCIPRLAANISVGISTLGYQAELIGSAALVIENRLQKKILPAGPIKAGKDFAFDFN